MITEKTKPYLETLYKDETLNGRGLVRQFIILNTYKPKYNIGEFVEITDETSHRVWGNRIINVKAKITEIHWFLRDKGEEHICYSAIALDQFGNDIYLCAEESIDGSFQERRITGRAKDNKNVFEKKDKYIQCCSAKLYKGENHG